LRSFDIARILRKNTSQLKPSQKKRLEYLFRRRLSKDEFIGNQLSSEMISLSLELQREINILFDREGRVIDVILGKRDGTDISLINISGIEHRYYSRIRLIKTSFGNSISERDLLLLIKFRLDYLLVINNLNGKAKKTAVMRLPPGAEERLEYIPLDGGESETGFYEIIEGYEEETRRFKAGINGKSVGRRAIIAGCGIESDMDINYYLDELASLLKTLNIDVVHSVWQRREPDASYLVGRGKLSELRYMTEIYDADMVVFFNTLTPVQKRNIEDEIGYQIQDRNQIILSIFAKRAVSNEGKLQVELARLRYELPRLSEKDAGLSRLVGGFKTKGPGETKLEMMRRQIKDRIARTNEKILQIKQRREFTREKRRISGIPIVAIVGYTNAGKSTLLNRITKSSVYVEDRLFATLDTTTRKYVYPDGMSVLFSDTVGFIKDLPEELKNAFMSTFEEINEASLILHLVDASSPSVHQHIETVEEILVELGVDHIPRLLIFNKADRLDDIQTRIKRSDGILISALTGQGIDTLLKRIRGQF